MCNVCLFLFTTKDVLGAFALMRQDVGYVQSMSYIAAMFLLYFPPPPLSSAALHLHNYSDTHVTRHTSRVTRHPSHVTHSYSDTPFDAFVAFSNVIVRPFFQNFFKRREVCRTQAAFPCALQSLHLTAVCCACNRSICRRDTMLSSSSSAVRCSPLPRPSVSNCSSLVRCRESSGLEPQVRRQANL